MNMGDFIPLGSGLDDADSKFVRIAGPGGVDEEPPMETAVVTPAEANNLSGQIRSILGEHLSGANLDTAASAIEASVAAAPARVALPEIKLTPAAPTEGEATAPDAEPAEQPTINVEREGDTVRRVHVNCTCGQTIQLDCISSQDPPAEA